MTKKTAVVLPSGWPGEWKRTMRVEDANGNVVPVKDDAGNDRVLRFSPGQPVELDADELEAVRDDVGKTIRIAKAETLKDGTLVGKMDDEATNKFVEETKKQRQQETTTANAKKAADAREATRASSTATSASNPRDREHKAK